MNRQQVINASKGNVSDRPRCVTGNMIAVLPWKRLTVVTKRDVVGRRFFSLLVGFKKQHHSQSVD